MRVLTNKQLLLPVQTLPAQTLPAQAVQFVKPLSYEFRVAEYLDEKANVVKVGLQVKTIEHDEYGSPSPLSDWTNVPRVKIDLATGVYL